MLKTSTVHRKLDACFKIGGIEATDLIAVMILAAILNIFLGQFALGPVFIFGIPAILAVILYFGKRGKPEGYLVQFIKFYISHGNLIAGVMERK